VSAFICSVTRLTGSQLDDGKTHSRKRWDSINPSRLSVPKLHWVRVLRMSASTGSKRFSVAQLRYQERGPQNRLRSPDQSNWPSQFAVQH
jgi:hypothetical protein